MSDHTPVPWEARKNMVPHIEDDSMVWDGDFIIWEDDNPIACVNCCDGIGEEQAEMNANLMAASIEMREALESALDSLEFASSELEALKAIPPLDEEILRERIRKADAILAKARGKTE